MGEGIMYSLLDMFLMTVLRDEKEKNKKAMKVKDGGSIHGYLPGRLRSQKDHFLYRFILCLFFVHDGVQEYDLEETDLANLGIISLINNRKRRKVSETKYVYHSTN